MPNSVPATCDDVLRLVSHFLNLVRCEFFGNSPKTGDDRMFPGLTPHHAIHLVSLASFYRGRTDASRDATIEIQNWMRKGAAK